MQMYSASIEDENAEIKLLLAGIQKRYGYDFTHYSDASLKRRLYRAREKENLHSFTQLLERLLSNERSFDQFLRNMSITVTDMFRNPLFYKAVRTNIIPMLRTFPFIKIWHAGCATGEEAYSMAILLYEEGFLDRTRIYATDFNKHSLDIAEKGVYPAKNLAAYANNYSEANGKETLSAYYSTSYEWAKIKDYIKEHVTFSYHNLVTDGVFGEMNVICCRNVLIYFDKTLQDQVLGRFTESLRHGGFLCLGDKESLKFTTAHNFFEPVDSQQRIYKKSRLYHAH